jgi:uncharacterized membrane protein YphA (DoxX/SURF4 family)
MKVIKLIFRFVLGIVFTFSGIVKAIDPLGSEYKFTDYFTEAFGMPSLSSISMILGIVLAAFEFLVGICLLLNVKPRLSALGALIFMVIFTPLTLYIAIFSPVEDCGCFGDAIKLSNWDTFIKNLVMLPMAIFLFKWNKGNCQTYTGKIDWIAASVFFLGIVWFQFYALQRLPLIDFMPYKVGTYIPEKMVIPQDKKADEYAVFYTMKHMETGETKQMSDKDYLAQWTEADTIWEITGTSAPKLIKKGYQPPIYNFKAYPIDLNNPMQGSTEDMMGKILSENTYSLLVVSYDIHKAKPEGFKKIEEILQHANQVKVNVHFLTSTSGDLHEYINKFTFKANYYNSDPTTLKTVIRANPGILLLNNGTIMAKWHYNDLPTIEKFNELVK